MSGSTPITWKRDGAGRQVSTCGRYAVQVDGYRPSQNADGADSYAGGEWAAILLATDENLEWYPTMREAKAHFDR